MEKSTHTERVAVALAMRNACAEACASLAGEGREDGISKLPDRILVDTAIRVCNGVDLLAVVDALGGSEPSEQEAFELAAKAQYFSVQKNDRGEYSTPITARAYKVWQMAMQFKAGSSMEEIAPPAPADTGTVTVTIAGMPARMPVADAALLGVAAAVSSPAVTDATLIAPAEELALAQALPGGAELSPAAQVLNEEEGAKRFAAHHRNLPAPAGPPTLKLGDISTRLKFTITADFLLFLGFAPAATEKNSKLFHEADFASICAALQRHIADVQAKF